jgi:hypothetical protein
MADVETFSEVIDRLYGLPLEEFTPARDAAAKELRAAGERDAAAEVKRLRKPSRLAWALNQVRRHDPEPMDELIAAGERLQEAQRQLVEAGERGLLRDAAAEERELVGRIADLAERELATSGHPATATAQGKLFSTLHAAAADPEVRDALAAGRLLGEHQLSDLGLVPGSPAPSEATRGGGGARREGARKTETPTRRRTEHKARESAEDKERAAAERKARAAAEREARQLTTKLERARERSHALAKQQKEAERGLADAQRAAERAAAAVQRAAASAERARGAAQEAAQRVGELEAELRQIR